MEEIFGFSLHTYLWVIALSSVAGAVKFLHDYATQRNFEFLILIRDILAGALSGLMAFWLAESLGVNGPLCAVAVSIAGIMGVRAWDEFERILKIIIFRTDGQSTTRRDDHNDTIVP